MYFNVFSFETDCLALIQISLKVLIKLLNLTRLEIVAPGACWCFFNNMLYGFSQIDAGLLSSNVVLSRFFLLSVYELTSGESRESVIYLLCKGRFELV